MITYDEMWGRLGNILLSIAQTFVYCDKYNINYNYICFTTGQSELYYNNYLRYKNNLFYNIQKYFIDNDEWKNITEKNIKVRYWDFHERNLNTTFINTCWGLDVIYNPNIWKIFYNKNIFENFIKKLPPKYSDYKNRIALHIRRDDFLTYCNGEFIRSIEEINEILSTGDKFFIFSDGMEWCKKNIHNNNCIFVDDLIDAECIMLMGYCKNIIKNNGSTFSGCAKTLNEYLTLNNLKI